MHNKRYKLAISLSLIGVLLLSTPTVSLAATTYHISCSGTPLTPAGGAACSGASIDFTGSGTAITTSMSLTPGTWYLNWDTPDSGSLYFSDGQSGGYHLLSGTQVDTVYVDSGGSDKLIWDAQDSTFRGVLNNICITDTAGACAGGGGGGGGVIPNFGTLIFWGW